MDAIIIESVMLHALMTIDTAEHIHTYTEMQLHEMTPLLRLCYSSISSSCLLY